MACWLACCACWTGKEPRNGITGGTTGLVYGRHRGVLPSRNPRCVAHARPVGWDRWVDADGARVHWATGHWVAWHLQGERVRVEMKLLLGTTTAIVGDGCAHTGAEFQQHNLLPVPLPPDATEDPPFPCHRSPRCPPGCPRYRTRHAKSVKA